MRDNSSQRPEPEIKRALAEAAFTLAERCRDGELSRDQAIDELRAGYPELSEGQYQDAFSRALFSSR
jgi:hypothetical protein